MYDDFDDANVYINIFCDFKYEELSTVIERCNFHHSFRFKFK